MKDIPRFLARTSWGEKCFKIPNSEVMLKENLKKKRLLRQLFDKNQINRVPIPKQYHR